MQQNFGGTDPGCSKAAMSLFRTEENYCIVDGQCFRRDLRSALITPRLISEEISPVLVTVTLTLSFSSVIFFVVGTWPSHHRYASIPFWSVELGTSTFWLLFGTHTHTHSWFDFLDRRIERWLCCPQIQGLITLIVESFKSNTRNLLRNDRHEMVNYGMEEIWTCNAP